MRSLTHSRQTGLALVTIAFLFAPAMDVFAKLLTQAHSPGQVVMGRFLVQSALMLPLLLLTSQWCRPRAGHWMAGAFLGAALLCFNSALQVMPIANAIAIFFVEPLILTFLSAVILKETIGWRRIAAVIVGLIGAIVVIRPNLAAYGPAAILPLGTATFFACYVLVTRVMTLGGQRIALQFWTGVSAFLFISVGIAIGTVVDAPALALSTPGAYEISLFVAMGVVAIIAHQMLVVSLSMIPASVFAPMQYLEIVSATLFGWWIFGDFPDPLTWIGTAIIVASGIYVFHRERVVGEGQ